MGNLLAVLSQASNAGRTLRISLQIASHHNVFPFSASRALASAPIFGILIPNLCVFTQYFDLTFAIMRFLYPQGTHQAKAGSSAILDATVYSATWTGYASFISLRATQVVLPSFCLMRSSHPWVVSFLHLMPLDVVTNASAMVDDLLLLDRWEHAKELHNEKVLVPPDALTRTNCQF